MNTTYRQFFTKPFAAIGLVGLASSIALLSGCVVGPNYSLPSVALPSSFGGAPTAAIESDSVDPQHWWESLHDAELDRLISLALVGNIDLLTAQTRITTARIQERIAGAALHPTVGANAGVNHIDFSKNAGLSSIASALGGSGGGGGTTQGQGVALPGNGISTWSLGLDASWEIDLFGGTQRSIEGARARLEAAQLTARDIQVSLIAEIVASYLSLRSLQDQLSIAREELARQQAISRLINARHAAGLINEVPKRQQALTLANVSATVPQLEASIANKIHALGLLTGEGSSTLATELSSKPATTYLTSTSAQPTQLLPPVSVGLPSELLRRRPDIRAAERQLAAATADIGVATAELYPKFNLMGMAEVISTSLGTLFQKDSLQATGNAAVSLPIFDGGRRRAVIAASNANADVALLAYKKSILVAVQDVENALSDFKAEQQRNVELRGAVVQAEAIAKLGKSSFDTGLVDFGVVLDAQGAVLISQNNLARSNATLLVTFTRLYKAIGGGWNPVALL